MSKDDQIHHVKTVPVTAHTTARDHNRIYDHAVSLTLNWEYKWILVIEETPGQWYMETLLLGWPEPDEVEVIRVPETMAVDAGQEWMVLNWREVMTAAIREI
jgi:hypothetical protein